MDDPAGIGRGAPADLAAGRAAYAARAWGDARGALGAADRASPLGAEDLERLAWAAALTGHDRDMIAALERAHAARLAEGATRLAARDAFWAGMRHFSLGEPAQAGGWLARSQRLVAEGEECAEQGLLLLPAVQRHLARGELAEARETASRAASIGVRCRDADLVAFARCLEGRAAIRLMRIAEGLALLDETMIAASRDEVSPLVAGLVYCHVLASCQQAFAWEQCREWTSLLSHWCETQPQLGIFSGICLVHRAEVYEWNGAWDTAQVEVDAAVDRLAAGPDAEAKAAARYRQGELCRLRGDAAGAEAAYRAAEGLGLDPQPGLALLRLAAGNRAAALAQIRRVLTATSGQLRRARFLPAAVEVFVACDEAAEAQTAAEELAGIAAAFEAEALTAMARHATGSVRLLAGRPGDALEPLRESLALWLRLGAPYLAARIRVLVAASCAALGDADAAKAEYAAAAREFERIGAAPDLENAVRRQGAGPGARSSHGLTARELQVLALVATGETNKGIARTLGLSEKTVDRHVSNIFGKLDVSSRAAATATAIRLDLVPR
ncbi:MAG: helix-turn-helix transcriptional regulator [Devosia nanyangense]|uniref:Helix-turn-helix transcriptional regulator n=1 Tax=Devosia nanyangense TaxID=1228055 RepID=A0A933NXJ0_9HYPH|nr:helix-turn-helix transcriptional regulator [Devosia nanyangense]